MATLPSCMVTTPGISNVFGSLEMGTKCPQLAGNRSGTWDLFGSFKVKEMGAWECFKWSFRYRELVEASYLIGNFHNIPSLWAPNWCILGIFSHCFGANLMILPRRNHKMILKAVISICRINSHLHVVRHLASCCIVSYCASEQYCESCVRKAKVY